MRLLSPDLVERARGRLQQPEFAAARRALHRQTDRFLRLSLQPPSEPAGFYHDYFCDRHAVQLTFDPERPSQHVCSVDQRRFQGSRFDAAWRFGANLLLGRSAWQLAVRWRLEGDERCRQRAQQLLLGYAGCYLLFPVGSVASAVAPGRGHGRIAYQSLDEAHLLLAFARTYDLLQEDFPSASGDVVERDLLALGLRHLRAERFDAVHNIECWHLAAMVALGSLLEARDVLTEAVEGKFGFSHQLDEGVLADGMWWEGSFSYHYYAVAPMLVAASFDHGPGGWWRSSTRLRQMLRAPLELVQPDWQLPATNDSWPYSSLTADVCHGIPSAAALYEMAAGCWPEEEAFREILALNYKDTERDSLEALLYGPDRVGTNGGVSAASLAAEATGLIMLRGSGPPQHQTTCLLKFGPHGGRHGHPDKLSVSLYARGVVAAIDLGTAGYGIGLNEQWYRQTASHNTALVDGEAQPPHTGQLIHFDAGGEPPSHPVGVASVSWTGERAGCYDGVRMLRTVGMGEGYLVDCFSVAAPDLRRMDLLLHVAGTPAAGHDLFELKQRERSGGLAALPDAAGWDRFEVQHAGPARDVAQLRWQLSAPVTITMLMPQEGGSELTLARTPGNPASFQRSTLVRTRWATTTRFLAVIHSVESDPPVVNLSSVEELNIRGSGYHDRWQVAEHDGMSMLRFIA